MTRFGQDDFPGAERGRLKVNYRSVEEVTRAFLQFAADMHVVNGADIQLDSVRGKSEFLPEYREVETDDEEIAAVAEAIEEMRRAGHTYRDQAILCTGNDRLGRIADGIEQLGIPVLYLGNLFERNEIKELLCMLSLIVDRRAMGLLRVAAMNEYAVSLADVDCLLAYLREHETEPLKWAESLESIEGLTSDGQIGLKRIAVLLEDFESSAAPWTLIATVLLDRTRIAAKIAENCDNGGRSRGVAIWQFMNFLRSQPPGKGLPIVRVLERIRRLVLNSDERDLRQLPAAAQSIDAVRVMTMHGSKGLEFPVVHIPGLTAASLPRSPNSSIARGITPPDGLIEGTAESGINAIRDAMIEEQECLFFVALSRARDRLFLYYPTTTSNGRSRARSPFIDRLGRTASGRQIAPSMKLPPSDGEIPVPLTIQGSFKFSDHQLALYERCPRRFLYTHIIKIGGRRTESAFMKLHVAVQHVVDSISTHPGETLPASEIEGQLATEWDAHGPADHGYSDEYKRIAWQLIKFYVDSASELKRLPQPELRLPIPGGEIIVTPDQVLEDGTGKIIMRRVDTGHQGSKDDQSLAAAAFHIAANSHFPGCTVQLVYLSDSEIIPVAMTARVIENRKDSISKMGKAVKIGYFPPKVSMTCPRCPAYFVCGRLPSGPLQKKILA
jgi:hypothetical protein